MLSTDGLNCRSVLVKLIAAGLVLGLHLVALALVLAVPAPQSEIQPSDAADVQMVEISMDPPEAAPNSAPAQLPAAAPIAEQAPPVEPPKHERKPEHKTRPKHVIKPAEPTLRPKSAKMEIERPADAVASAAKAVTNTSSSAPSRLAQTDQPRLIGRVDYLGRRPIPVYPRLSERRGEHGRVIVRVLISAQGSVVSMSVRNSSGYPRLDAAALDAVRSAHFKPYTENGIAHAAMADIPFDFVL